VVVQGVREQERRALVRLRAQLVSHYAGRCSSDEITEVIDRASDRFAGARIRDFVPVLVEQIVREDLRRAFGPVLFESESRP
jgi:hypothetical protein